MLSSRFWASSCLVVVLLTGLAQGQQPAPADPEEIRILTYDVGDLILDVPDYPYPGTAADTSLFRSSRGGMGGGMSGGGGTGMGGMGGGFMAVPDRPGSPGDGSGMGMGGMGGMVMADVSPSGSRSAKITMEDLKRVLISMVAPNTWAEVGGEGELQHLGPSLVVRQTVVVHQEIQDLLEQLREGAGNQKTVAIDARWLLLTSDELEKLMPPHESDPPQIDRDVLGEFTRRSTSIRGQTNCFTGQLVYLVSGTRRNVVTSFVPVVGSLERPRESQYASLPGGARVFEAQLSSNTRAVGYQPVIATPNLGVLLQIRPTLVPGDSKAIVDLRSTLTVLADTQDLVKPNHSPQDAMVPTVDRVAIETQELATTLSVPLGEPALAGGLTYIEPSMGRLRQAIVTDAKQPAETAETPQLYLILEVR